MEGRCENCIVRQFYSLNAMSKKELRAVSDSKTSKTVRKGEPIFKEGEKLNGVYCVRKGVSKLSKLSTNGKDQIVKLAAKGELMGQRSVISEERANLSAIAVSDMEVCFIPKTRITDTLSKNPDFALKLLRKMASDLREADEAIVNLGQKTVRQRMAETLLYLQDFGTDKEGYFELILSREDISNVVGTATESAIRVISELKKKGLIMASGKKLGIKDEKGLREIAEGI